MQAVEDGNQLSKLKRTDPEQSLILLIIEIEGLLKFFKTKRSLETEKEIYDLAKFIQKQFWYLKFEEIKLCFHNARLGFYGRVLDRLDSATIVSWIGKYDTEDKCTYALDKNSRHKLEEIKSKETLEVVDYENWKERLDETRKKEKEQRQHSEEFERFKVEYFAKKEKEQQEYLKSKSDGK